MISQSWCLEYGIGIEQKNKDGITSERTYLRDTETLNQIKKTCNNWINKPIQKVTIENKKTN